MAFNDKTRYWFLQLQLDFFNTPLMLRIKTMPSGKCIALAYLELMLLAGKNKGYLHCTGFYSSPADEFATVLRGYSVDEIELALKTCLYYGLITFEENSETYYFTESQILTSSITGSGIRKRNYRGGKKNLPSEERNTALGQGGDNEGTLSPIYNNNNNNNNNNNKTKIDSLLVETVDNSTLDVVQQRFNASPKNLDSGQIISVLEAIGVSVSNDRVRNIIQNYKLEDIKKSVAYARNHCPEDISNFAGWAIKCIELGQQDISRCTNCHGRGFIRKVDFKHREDGSAYAEQYDVECPICHGSGEYEE